MASRSSVPGIRIARLERTARLARECFGHEELAPLSPLRSGLSRPSRLALLAGLAAGLIALAMVSLP